MTEMDRKMLFSLVTEGEEKAYKRLKSDEKYLEICQRQEQSGEIVEKYYQERFTKEERIEIRRHYEGETERDNYEINEVYIQGLRDCFNLVIHLGLLLD